MIGKMEQGNSIQENAKNILENSEMNSKNNPAVFFKKTSDNDTILKSVIANGLSENAIGLISRLSDETRNLIAKALDTGTLQQDTVMHALNYFAKLEVNREVNPSHSPSAAENGLTAATQALGAAEATGSHMAMELAQAGYDPEEYRRQSHERWAEGRRNGARGYTLEELGAGAALRESGLGAMIARDAGIDLSKGAL
ncbi:hypothetical protein [Niveispirillum fermenti]|uniref:hypothetical protein n=1 Tax=Niveispirillum fermenti TaxID=1233113 RepID=UPI003A8C0849